MARQPGLTQRRYRGRLRIRMQEVSKALVSLLKYDEAYRALPCEHYPQQLAPPEDVAKLFGCLGVVQLWLLAKGPIPTRAGCPTT